jgi:hypothetical protein
MICNCWMTPRGKHSYLVYAADRDTGQMGRCVIQSECQHGMAERLIELADRGQLVLLDQRNEKFSPSRPVLIHIDTKGAAHIPILDKVS